MSHLQTFQVYPYVPESLSFLEVMIRNLWWSWNLDAIELSRRISPKLWEQAERNPIVFSTLISQKRLEELSTDQSFLAHLERVKARFHQQVELPVDIEKAGYAKDDRIAYFSMEFGIHESLPLFAGGLGILAGDHLKAASDLGVPLVGIGLLYRRGYFHQFLDPNGWQQEEYPESDLYHIPVERALDKEGKELHLSVPGPDGEIQAIVWKINVGRVPLYLLDTNLQENPPHIREITSRLYAGEQRVRLAQEVLLGIGGMRALEAMGIFPTICHMNEGHCAFAGLERIAQTMKRFDVNLETAMEIVPRTTIFTTHTPVAAGHDEFPSDMVRPYLSPYQKRLGVNTNEILSWGQQVGAGPDGPLSMFVLGMRMAQHCNGVSQLHGSVARRMWAHVWPGRPEDEVPIAHITNGVHIASFISIENALLFERYLGPDWSMNTADQEIFRRIDEIYDEELWRAHEMARTRLIRTCRKLMVRQYARRNAPKAMMREAESALDQDVLTIAFARRFATYKRANLLFHDPDRLEAILSSKERPVQIIFAGKAHPKDNEGKELIRRIIEFARRPVARHRIVFLEDYDINIARHLVQGADIWLNNPRRPFEACGTSGMKAAVNGVLNLSILDGWWCEGYSEERGWRIGNGEEYTDPAYQDAVESQALYNVLENDVIPTFYERRNGDAPSQWLKMMKESIKMVMRFFSAHGMVRKYESNFYIPSGGRLKELVADQGAEAKRLFLQKKRLRELWHHIRVADPVREEEGAFRVGKTFRVTTRVFLGQLKPEEVEVQLYYGIMKSIDSLAASHAVEMTMEKDLGGGEFLYATSIACRIAGRYGFTARATPKGDDFLRNMPGFITWA